MLVGISQLVFTQADYSSMAIKFELTIHKQNWEKITHIFI